MCKRLIPCALMMITIWMVSMLYSQENAVSMISKKNFFLTFSSLLLQLPQLFETCCCYRAFRIGSIFYFVLYFWFSYALSHTNTHSYITCCLLNKGFQINILHHLKVHILSQPIMNPVYLNLRVTEYIFNNFE